VYDVEFKSNGIEYEYTVDANNGKIIHSHVEEHGVKGSNDSGDSKVENNTQASDIGTEGAKEIALKHAGVSETEVRRLHVERDLKYGRAEYSVEFRVGNVEYDYEIAADSGKILEADREIDD
jgi:uncharacterized membrane protein YkoI